MTGGLEAATGEHHNDVWRLALGSFHGRWLELSPDTCGEAATPACRRSASALWDTDAERLVVLVGRDANHFFSDVWTFDPHARAWAPLATATNREGMTSP